MDEDTKKQTDSIVTNAIDKAATDSQFDITPTSGHTHNGSDALKVSLFNTDITPKPSASSLLGFDSTESLLEYIVIGTGLTYTRTAPSSGVSPVYTLTAAGVSAPVVTVFTSNGTWTKQASLKYVVVEVVGGGGKGGTGDSANYGCGGGGGGYSRKVIAVGTLGATETVTIGAGSTGSGGGTTSFGAHASATGGTDGAAAGGEPGTGGVGGGGDFSSAGQGGGAGSRLNGVGSGGSSVLGGGAGGILNSGTGNAGGQYGGGGSGGPLNAVGSVGGNGFAGLVVVTEYY